MKLGLVVIVLLLVFLSVELVRAEVDDSICVVSIEVKESVGNMDGSLDSGESGRIEIVLRNALGYEIRAVSGTISTNGSDVSITDGYAWWPNIGNGSSRNSLPNHMEIQLSPENREAIFFLSLVISWMDTESNGCNTTTNLSIRINHGYDVTVDTDGFHHDVTQRIIIRAEPWGKLDQKSVLGAQVTMSITEPDRTEIGPILLRDDGEGVDEEAGDGVYTARYQVMTTFPIGIHVVSVEATKNGFRGKSSASFKLSDPFLVWNKTLGGNEAMSVVSSGDGGFVIAGYADGNVHIMKVDSEGNKVWERNSGAGSDKAYAVVQSGDGGFVVAGYGRCPVSSADRETFCDIYLLKVDAQGDKVWEKIYEGDQYSCASCIIGSGNGSYIIGGCTYSTKRDTTVLYVFKIDSEGNEVWEKTYPPGGSWAFDITDSGDGGYVLTGFGNGEQNVYVIKIDSEGNKIWGKTYGGLYRDYGWAITRSDEGFIVAGSTYSYPEALLLLGLDQEGNKTWEKIYSKTLTLRADDIIQSRDGFIVVGRYSNRGTYLIKIDRQGNKLWETIIPYCREGTSITEAGDGGFIVVGTSRFYVAKINGTPYIPLSELPFGTLLLTSLLFLLKITPVLSPMKERLRSFHPTTTG